MIFSLWHSGVTALTVVAALAAPLAPAQTLAQTSGWPSKTIRLVTPSPVGVGSDTFARAYAEQLSKALGVAVIVENKPGASSTIGADAVAKAPADGHTLLFSISTPFTMAPFLFAKLPYNAQRDLVPVTQNLKGGSFLVVSNGFAASSLKALVAQAKASPGRFSYASYGSGSTAHIGFELLQDAAGIDMLHVPYKQSAMTDVIGGQIDVGFEPPISAIPLIKAGKVKALAYTGAKRSLALPDVPTLAETYPGLEVFTWQGIWVPAGTPTAIIQRLHTEISRITRSSEMSRRILDNGLEPMTTSPEDTIAIIRREAEVMGRIIKAKGITLD